jgi:uncharacterized protein
MSSNRTGGAVVVIMAKQPVAGRVKTRLLPALSPGAAARLSQALIEDTITLASRVAQVHVAVAVSPPGAVETWGRRLPHEPVLLPVEGPDIGACLAAATGHLFSIGFSRVIALSSDSPTLPVSALERAVALLRDADVVIGPCEDGGYYLVGLRAPCPGLFSDIDWGSERVSAQTRERADTLGRSTAWLHPWYDVDTPDDLERLSREASGLPAGVLASTRRVLAFLASEAVLDPDNGRSSGTADEPRHEESNP